MKEKKMVKTVQDLIDFLSKYDSSSPIGIQQSIDFMDGEGYHYYISSISDVDITSDGTVVLEV